MAHTVLVRCVLDQIRRMIHPFENESFTCHESESRGSASPLPALPCLAMIEEIVGVVGTFAFDRGFQRLANCTTSVFCRRLPVHFAQGALVARRPGRARNTRATPLIPSIAPSIHGRFTFHARPVDPQPRFAIVQSRQDYVAPRKQSQPASVDDVGNDRAESQRFGRERPISREPPPRPCNRQHRCERNNTARERFDSSIRSMSTTITCVKSQQGGVFQDLIPQRSGPDDQQMAAGESSPVPTRESAAVGSYFSSWPYAVVGISAS